MPFVCINTSTSIKLVKQTRYNSRITNILFFIEILKFFVSISGLKLNPTQRNITAGYGFTDDDIDTQF